MCQLSSSRTGAALAALLPSFFHTGEAPDCLTLIDIEGHRYMWPTGPGSSWQHELAIAQVFYRQHAGVEIVTAVGR
jgi:hypothetical protein